MTTKSTAKLEDLLIDLNIITKKQLDLIKVQSAESGQSIEKILIEMPEIPKEDLCKVMAISLNMPYVDLRTKKIDSKVLNVITRDMAEKYQVVPFGIIGQFLNVAMVDPNDVQSIDFIEKKTGFRIRSYMATKESLEQVIAQYENFSLDIENAISDISETKTPEVEIEKIKKPELDMVNMVQDAPITRAVNTIMEYAVKSRASDVHIEPREKDIKVRYRVDGILHNTMTLPKSIHPALVSRIKILSNLKIDEHRIPQDGRFQIKSEKSEIDLRVSVTPIVYGEKVVIRLLDKTSGIITLEELGIKGRAYDIIQDGIRRPHGMILSTGPTGSGKSTTLYAVLQKLNIPDVNIITVEDPVEYNINGINQIQVNNAVGLTFASGLRSILRQDPDIIMVGEVRDNETAELAVQSALTGHTVLSTLHTNSAAGALPRLLEMDIEPFLIASTVNTVMAQRLVRRICESCKEEYKATPKMTAAIKASLKGILPSKNDPVEKTKNLGFEKIQLVETDQFTLYRGKGCGRCGNTGFFGRIGVYEIFSISDAIENLVIHQASSADIQGQAIKEGMVTMRQDGFLKVLAGITTIQEIVRTTTDR